MANASASRPDSWDSDGQPRPPTFVQIRPPAASGSASGKIAVLGVGLGLLAALGWGVYRVTGERDAPVVAQAAPVPSDIPTPRQVFVDVNGDWARRAIDSAISTPVWSRETLMDRVSPFDPSASDRMASSLSPAETADTTQTGPVEISVRLGKGDTIGSALQRMGLASDTIANVISALAPHVRLKRLPTGLGMTAQIRRSGEDGAKPILQALTLHPDGGREIKVRREGHGDYAVERKRSPVR